MAPNESPIIALHERAVAEFEKARDAFSETNTRLLENVQQMVIGFQDIHRRVAAWRMETQEVVATVERFVAVGQEVAGRIAEGMTAASVQFKETLGRSDQIAKLGWTVHSNVPFVDLLHVSKLTSAAQADDYFLNWYEENDPNLEHMERRLRKHRFLVPFDTLLGQCFSAIRRGEYAITIPSLIPMLERVVTEFNPAHVLASTDVKKTLRKGGDVARKAEQDKAEQDILTYAVWLSLATFISDLYEKHPAVASPAKPRLSSGALSRHATQHGRNEPPNERIEVIRLLHALETALNLHQEIGVSMKPF